MEQLGSGTTSTFPNLDRESAAKVARAVKRAAPAQPPPSEAALLMALAEMHKQGRFAPKEPEA